MSNAEGSIDINAIREDFPALADGPFFDNGSVSLTPSPVAAALEQTLLNTLRHGPPHILRPEEEYPLREATMARIAGFLGTMPDQLALVRGVSEAFLTVLRGFDWGAGDEIVITEDEEAALLLPALHLRDSAGVRVVKLPFASASEAPHEALASIVTERTRLVALSQVTTTLGYRYPVSELCAEAARHGIPSFVDVAHSAGVIPLSLDELGCDFAGVLSYKWMYGPYAAGALYVRPAALGLVTLRYAGNRSEEWLDFDSDRYSLRESARRFEYGPFAWSIVHAWASAIEYLEQVGREQIIARTQVLVGRLRRELQTIDGVDVVTPAPEAAGAVVSFTVRDLPSQVVGSQLLMRRRIRIKAVPETKFVRASLAFFNSDDDIDTLVEAVAALAANRHAS